MLLQDLREIDMIELQENLNKIDIKEPGITIGRQENLWTV